MNRPEFIVKTRIDQLCKKFGVKDAGDLISNLRNGITHPVRSKKDVLGKIQGQELIHLTEVLFTIIVSYILKKVGVTEEVTHAYQYPKGVLI